MQERINKIKEYFVAFNIAEGISYIKVKFPKKWEIPNVEILKENFKVSIAEESDGDFYFFSELTNGIDNVFDAVDFVVEFNKDLEAKTQLFTEKINELKELFSTKSLSDLQHLEIVINLPMPLDEKSDKGKDKSKRTRKNNKKEKNNNENSQTASEVSVKNNEELVQPNTPNVDDMANGVSLLDYAQNLVEVNVEG